METNVQFQCIDDSHDIFSVLNFVKTRLIYTYLLNKFYFVCMTITVRW